MSHRMNISLYVFSADIFPIQCVLQDNMNCVWFVAGVLVFLQISSSLAMVLFEDDPVKVNFCCPDGEILRLRSVRDHHMAECVRRKDLKNNLEGKEVPVVDSNNNQTEFAMRKLSKLDNKKPNCARGLDISKLNFNQTSK